MTGLCLHAREKNKPAAANRKENETMNGSKPLPQLEAYAHADSKYNLLPIPTPIPKGVALAFVTRELPHVHGVDGTVQLSRLAVFYDLRETAGGFLALLKLGEPEPHDFLRSAAALSAVGWLGDADQFAKAAAYFSALAKRADLELHQGALLDTAYALGPRLGSEPLRQAVGAVIADLEATHRQQTQQGAGVRQLDILENRVARLQEFSKFELAALDKANALCKTIDDLPPRTQIARLAELYLGDAPESTSRLGDWAAIRLLRIDSRPEIAAEFMALSKRYEKANPERQKELDASRARTLRAAGFFGAHLADPQRHWLAEREDAGADPLALRPDWKYPAPHVH